MSCLQKLINVKLSIPLIDNKGMSCVRHASCEKAHYRRLSKSGMLFVVFTDFGLLSLDCVASAAEPSIKTCRKAVLFAAGKTGAASFCARGRICYDTTVK